MIYVGERDLILAQLDVIRVLVAHGEPGVQRALVEDTPWVKVRWANPRYL